ncbi:molybdate transport system permease protein [Flavobacterium sp. 1]|uniref:molybdate ABC transporter permease subunit n=1 Tax=Flavobacterium sp. 1 TaxID=2035200 RepID=UPI000C232439|nr:molybdate ABC transporter permease subunit [Flavobacterium sp. 1]PJJ09735.1 molybdate transport system permease protein [Flavobacterium sp. 1]
MIDFEPIYLTLKLAFTTTVILLIVGLPLAYWLAYSKIKSKVIIEAVVSLPLVLPPSVLGFYLLIAFSPENAFGKFLDNYFDIRLVFTFTGLVISSVLYSLPFMVQPAQSGFKSISKNLIDASYTLGKSKWQTVFHVLLPNMKMALLTGIVLSFAHTIGEFGVVLMVGGSIPNETKVVSIAVFDEVTAMNYHDANVYSAILLIFSFVVLLSVYSINHRFSKISPLP